VRNKAHRDLPIRLAGRLGFHATPRTSTVEVRNLIKALRPVQAGAPLIRLGPDGDGGYLVPDDLAGIEYAFSPGVSTESGFEAALANRGMQVFLADYSVDRPAVSHPNFTFDKRFIGGLSNDTFMTLDEWKQQKIGAATGDLLLQMDTEGAEYESLFGASPALLRQFRIMVIEFHDLQELWNAAFFGLAARAFRKVLGTHAVVHIHPNNCCGAVKSRGLEIPRVAEFTFLRRDRVRGDGFCTQFPHPLDRKNTRRKPVDLHPCWYT
jgi:hypothetical protein